MPLRLPNEPANIATKNLTAIFFGMADHMDLAFVMIGIPDCYKPTLHRPPNKGSVSTLEEKIKL
jgi:hypothetical protein